jgi:pimeloyl-ACP methyl ester carboxylesterase
MRRARFGWLAVFCVVAALTTTGCGTFMAKRIAQAPNSYPTWFAPHARVELDYDMKFLTNFPAHFIDVGPPAARMRYRVIEPADYNLEGKMTNWTAHGRKEFRFTFHADVPGATNRWTAAPRGTAVLLHGYGLAQFSMAPWALRLAQDGWRCVLVDLRGHGKSTGRRIFFGVKETADLSELLDALTREKVLSAPVAAMGESYGAALALRWKTVEPRVGPVVAIAPYAELSNAVVNIGHDYAGWVPGFFVRTGIAKLPEVLQVPPDDLDTTTVLARDPVPALFIAGGDDKIAPEEVVERLEKMAGPGSRLVVVPDATHEAVTYYFKELTAPVLDWLDGGGDKEVEPRKVHDGPG